MSGTVNPERFCTSIVGDSHRKDELITSCVRGVNVCNIGEEGSFTLVTQARHFVLEGSDRCLRMVGTLTRMSAIITKGTFKPESESTDESHASSESKPAPPPSTPPAPPPAAPANQSGETPSEEMELPEKSGSKPVQGGKYENCLKVGPEGSAGNGTCNQIMDICMSSENGPYKIPIKARFIEIDNQPECISIAPTLANAGYKIVDPSETGAKPKKEKEPSPSPAPAPDDSVQPSPSPKQDDVVPPPEAPAKKPANLIKKSFADIGLRLKVTDGSYTEVKRTLHFQGGKGLKIKLRYAIEKLSDGSYKMKYTISKNDHAIGGEQSITFQTKNKTINLGFAIALGAPNNFGTIKSMSIVDLG